MATKATNLRIAILRAIVALIVVGTSVFAIAMYAPVAFAQTDGGSCGEGVTWSYDSETKTLSIEGSGPMTDYGYAGKPGAYHTTAPWGSHVDELVSVTIAEGVTSVGEYAFYDCEALTAVSLPSTLETIGACGFDACTALASVSIPSGVTAIGDEAFAGCGIESIVIPDSVIELGEGAFVSCKNLVTVSLSNGIDEIADDTFRGCTSLKSVEIPDSVSRICENAFDGCTSLESVTIDGYVTWIQDFAFYGCESLTSIVLPKGLNRIGQQAFAKCALLSFVQIESTTVNVGPSAFHGMSANSVIQVRNKSLQEMLSSSDYISAGKTKVVVSDYAPEFATRLYTAILDREPDEKGLNVQGNALRNGAAPAEIVYNYFNSQEYFEKHEDAEATVERVYQVMFGRDSDEEGKAFWVAKLEAGMSVRAVVQGFSEAQEYRNYFGGYDLDASVIPLYSESADKAWDSEGDLVYTGGNGRDLNQGATEFAKRMYTVVLGRDAEVGGLNAQAGAVAKGMPCWQIAVNFFGSDEFAGKGYSTSEAVAIAYEAILGRTGSEEEVGWWVGVAERDCYTVTDVVLHFCNSDEFNDICAGFGLTSGMRGRGAAALPVPRAHTWSGPQCVRCGASMPVHEHSWTYHEAVYAPMNVEVGTYVLCSCGAQFSSTSAWNTHNKSLGFGVSHSYSTHPVYEVQQVCVREAYYSCECGETKGQGE